MSKHKIELSANTTQTITIKKNKAERRKLLKNLASSGGLIAGTAAVPTAWKAPVIDDILLPAHARTSGTITLQVTVGDDIAPDDTSDGSDDSDGSRTYDPGSHTFPINSDDAPSDGLDDGFEQVLLSATVNPPSAVEVQASWSADYTNDVVDTDHDQPEVILSLESDAKTTSEEDGNTTFLITQGSDDDDINPDDTTGSLNLRVSAPGYGESTVIINFSDT